MKRRLSTGVLVLIFLAGLSLLLYPTVSDYWNSLHQSRAITEYGAAVSKLDKETYDRILEDAREYNTALATSPAHYNLNEEERREYESQLDVSDNGVIACIEIPKIHCSLPIYRGTDEGTLQKAIGHLEWTSLPVGGKSTHCVLSGHRGLPSARLFTDIDLLEEGDRFILRVMDEILTYEVDQIRTVLPEELKELQIVEGEDYCTLVTCTPYGVNSHRLLVRGHRVANDENAGNIRVTADAMQIDPAIVAPIAAVPLLLMLLVAVLIKTRRKKERTKEGGSDANTKKRY